jgi:hypothetical protein
MRAHGCRLISGRSRTSRVTVVYMPVTHPPRLRVIPGGLSEPGRLPAAVPGRDGESLRRWRLPEGLLAVYCLSAVATTAAVAAGGTRHPLVALAVLASALLAATAHLTFGAALAAGGIAWLFFDGFVIGRHGNLAWGGTREVWWILVLLGGALCGWVLGQLRHHG